MSNLPPIIKGVKRPEIPAELLDYVITEQEYWETPGIHSSALKSAANEMYHELSQFVDTKFTKRGNLYDILMEEGEEALRNAVYTGEVPTATGKELADTLLSVDDLSDENIIAICKKQGYWKSYNDDKIKGLLPSVINYVKALRDNKIVITELELSNMITAAAYIPKVNGLKQICISYPYTFKFPLMMKPDELVVTDDLVICYDDKYASSMKHPLEWFNKNFYYNGYIYQSALYSFVLFHIFKRPVKFIFRVTTPGCNQPVFYEYDYDRHKKFITHSIVLSPIRKIPSLMRAIINLELYLEGKHPKNIILKEIEAV